MKTVTVNLTPAQVNVLDQPVLLGIDVNKALRKAGAPVSGKIWPYRVEHGELTMRVNADTGVTFTWVGEGDEPKGSGDEDLF